MRNTSSLCLCGILLVALLFAASVLAGGEETMVPVPGGDLEMRYITPDADTTTSKCIGNPKTPMCAFETYLACRDWGLYLLCDVARGKTPPIEEVPNFKTEFVGTTCYRVLGSWRYTRLYVPNHLNPWEIKPDDVAIDLQTANLRANGLCDEFNPSDNRNALLRRGKFGWFVVDADNRREYVLTPHLVDRERGMAKTKRK